MSGRKSKALRRAVRKIVQATEAGDKAARATLREACEAEAKVRRAARVAMAVKV